MAKTTPILADHAVATEPALSSKLSKVIETLRVTFNGFVADYAALQADRATLAPRLMRAFAQWQTETGHTSFVAFVRVLVPGVPLERAGYRAHSAYQAADYLRRLTQQASRTTETPVEKAARIQSAPVSSRVALARLVASLLPLISPDSVGTFWSTAAGQLHWSEATLKGIQDLAKAESPLVTLKTPRGVHMTHGFRVVGPANVQTEDQALAS